eukprot:Pgem_evm1s2465
MGVKGVLNVFNVLMSEVPVSHFNGTIGIDMSMLIHCILRSHAQEILLHDDWSNFLTSIHNYLHFIQSWAGDGKLNEIICVFDGFRDERKLANASRSQQRINSLEK